MYTQIKLGSFKEFIKNHKKVYFLSGFISLLICALLVGYNWKISCTNLYATGEEITFLLENKEGNPYQNSEDIRKIFLLQLNDDPTVSKEIKEELNKNLTVTRDASNFFIVTVDNYLNKENTFVKDKLLSYLKQGEISFFKDKTIIDLSENTKEIFAPTQEAQILSIKKIVIYLIGGFILFVILGTILATILSRKNTVINDDFSFLVNDQIVNISHFSKLDKQACIENTLMNIAIPTIIITQLHNLKLINDNHNIVITDDLGHAFLPPFEAHKILLICEKGETTKEWYQLQMELSKIYSDDIDIILI
ncbi:MAG: hypothetical protein IC227_04220 [Enterococcus lacertideformus]|uniref:Uncharacterized protein n=1 Tax=Enterococcus lacertideformus TaxID=2771493 RepID=A0A931FAS0_9ENTE|nr:hypothetical protein [Enterococcus lacertideformus]